MRNKRTHADKRLPASLRALWYSEEKRKQMGENRLNLPTRDKSKIQWSMTPVSEATDSNTAAPPPDGPRLTFNTVASALSVTDADLTGSTFYDVNLSKLSVANARLAGATFADVDFSGAQFSDVNFSNVSISDSQIEGMTIDGVLVSALLSAADTVDTPKATFRAVFAIGNSDPAALPVKEIAPAVAYYANVLGFTPVSSENGKAILRRDDVQIGLEVNGRDPEQASVYFAVSDVNALRAELISRYAGPGEIRIDEYDGAKYRVFFAKEPYGVCFCFGQKNE